MFLFASNLQLAADMMQNTKVHYHANQVIKTLEKIVILLKRELAYKHISSINLKKILFIIS